MSAWIVSRKHIDAIVGGLIVHKVIAYDDADAIGQMLWRENYRSVNYRYNKRTRTPKYAYTPPEGDGCPELMLLGALHSYEYQSCEHADWEHSMARQLITALLAKIDPGNDKFEKPQPGDDRMIQAGWSIS